MVTEDYGKRAYVKLNSLEKRIEKLEKFSIESVYSEIFYNLAGAELNREFDKSFKVNGLKEGVYTISGNLATDLTSLFTVKLEIYVNGVHAYAMKNSLLSKLSFSFDAPLKKGENVILAKVSSPNIFSLTSLDFKICGSVSYVKSENSLSHICLEGVDYILHCCDDEFFVYRYEEGIFQKIGSYLGVKECSIISADEVYLYIIIVTNEKRLKLLTFDLTLNTFVEYDLNIYGVDSACGFKKDGKFIVYFSKLSNVYRGSYLLNSNFYYIDTGIKGVKLYSDPLSNGNMVVVDKYLNARLFTDWFPQKNNQNTAIGWI